MELKYEEVTYQEAIVMEAAAIGRIASSTRGRTRSGGLQRSVKIIPWNLLL
jgi:hypothetical protein